MKAHYQPWIVGLSLLGLAAAVAAEPPDYASPAPGEYGWVEVGVGLVPDLDGTVSMVTTAGSFQDAIELSLNPGFAVHGGLGERVVPWFGAEIQAGFLYNSVDAFSDATYGARPLDASLMQVPAFFNLVFELPLQSRFKPYLGAGVGAIVNWFDINDQIRLPDGSVVPVDETSTEVNFAYQGFAGLRIRLGESGVVSLNYRLLGMSDPTWSLRDESTGDSVANLKLKDLIVHSITIGFTVEF